MEAVYELSYKEDGVFLEINTERLANLDKDGLMHHLYRKKISGLNSDSAIALMESGGCAKIAPSQSEHIYGEELSVDVPPDELVAVVRLLAPEPDGPALKVKDALQILTTAGVIRGIDEAALSAIINSREYDDPFVVASAIPPEDGEDGKLIFHFSTDERSGCPVEIGNGRVDLRTLDLFVPVVEGLLLVSRSNATEGQPGITVKGNSIRQRPGKEIALPRGKNVRYNDDKTEMYATCSGMVEYVNNSVNVSNVYKINGDCDTSVGNIDFDGSVLITGSVRSGYTVKATDGISVGGSVESAKLIAGGNVEVKGGMQGAGRGIIEAGGSVSILYVEQGAIVADGPVKLDVSIHSRIEAGGTLHATGRRGAIIGGNIAVAGDVVANYLGALSNTRTEVKVGAMPRKRQRQSVIESELARLASERVKLDQLDRYLENAHGTIDDETWLKIHYTSEENRRINVEDTDAYTEELSTLLDEMEHATSSKVHVFETVFTGSRIVIGSNALKIDDEVSYATFKCNDGEVVQIPCEMNKGDVK